MTRRSLWLLALAFSLCFAQFNVEDVGGVKSICLYNSKTNKPLQPLKLVNSNCPSNTANCMNAIYKYPYCDFYQYGNWQYNGVASLKPVKGEVLLFLSQDQQGKVDFVNLLNANVVVTSKVWVQITGADPVDIILYDDPAPSDTWLWDNKTNTGNFTWTTQPGYTDGVVIGHINFIDNYCVRTSYNQLNTAIKTMSIISGNVTHPERVLTQNYTSGQVFEFCQYPVTGSTSVNATCPGSTDGKASIWIIFGPDNVQYSWYDDSGNKIASTTNVTGLAAANANQCNADRTVRIYDHTLYGAFVTTAPFACVTKGSASATPNGGSSGFTYTWFKSTGTQVGTGTSVSGLDQGDYFVRVTDNCGSVATTNFTIGTSGCCGDGICQANETCGSVNQCTTDCGACCPAGTYVTGSTCTVCPPGSRSTTTQAASCTDCPANTYNAGGSDACTPCPANYQSDAGSGKCVRCPAGQVRGTSDSACHTCGTGAFAAPCDSSACADCAAGTVASADGAYFCNTCPPGTFAASGSASCQSCTAGTYSVAGSASCTSCPTGTTSSAGATHLLACA